MRCPYCTSDINDEAVVCPVCTRDLFLFKPLQARIEELEKKSEEQAAGKVRALEERIAALEDELHLARTGHATGTPAKAPHSFARSALISCVSALLLLLLAHGLIIIVYDLKPMFLRIASLLIPLPFGFALYARHPQHAWASAGVGALVGVAAVFGMSAVTGYVDNAPVLPQDMRDVKEFIEYAASIFFSLVTGVLVAKWALRKRRPAPPQPNFIASLLAKLLSKDEQGKIDVQETIERLMGLGASLAPVGTAAVSIYTGVKSLLGDAS